MAVMASPRDRQLRWPIKGQAFTVGHTWEDERCRGESPLGLEALELSSCPGLWMRASCKVLLPAVFSSDFPPQPDRSGLASVSPSDLGFASCFPSPLDPADLMFKLFLALQAPSCRIQGLAPFPSHRSHRDFLRTPSLWLAPGIIV